MLLSCLIEEVLFVKENQISIINEYSIDALKTIKHININKMEKIDNVYMCVCMSIISTKQIFQCLS